METAGANLLAAGTAEEAAMIPGAPAPVREAAATGFDAVAGRAGELAGEDPASARLVADQVDAQTRARTSSPDELVAARAAARTASTQLAARQRARRGEAKARVDDDTREQERRAGIAGGLALLAALLATLVAVRRRPLSRLLRATRRLAAGELHTRLNVRRPRDLRKLAIAFNAMAADLEAAEGVIDDQRQQLAKASEGLGDAVLMCGGDGRILEANRRARMLVPELSVGHDLTADRGPLPPLKKAASGEVEIEHRGRTLSVTARPLGETSEDGVAWTIRDVFEHARLERLKSELVATAAHELRSPLSSVNGFAGVLRASRVARRQRDLAEIVLHATTCLLGVVDHVLDIARAEPGRMEIHRRSIALAEALKEVAALMRPRLQERNQTLDLHMAPELPPAYAEPAKVRQLIADLLTVAHRHAPDGGRLSVNLASGAGEVVLATSHNGPELTDEQREKVLDRVRSLVDAHGRRVEIEPEPGWGSTVVVHLPQAPMASDPPPITAYATNPRIPEKIG
jgi:signal transduction histidine kinase/HAMP domain-containing protein